VVPYRFNALDRKVKPQPEWNLPAVLVADEREDDLRSIQKLAPSDGAWRLIYLQDKPSAARSRLDSRLFAVLPRQVPKATLAKAIEKVVNTLQVEEDRRRAGQQLRLVVGELETLNRIGVRSPPSATPTLLELI
jgi:hypothetical protein